MIFLVLGGGLIVIGTVSFITGQVFMWKKREEIKKKLRQIQEG